MNGGVLDPVATSKLLNDPDTFKSLMDEFYISILRTDKGQFLNEKRYILPPTKLS